MTADSWADAAPTEFSAPLTDALFGVDGTADPTPLTTRSDPHASPAMAATAPPSVPPPPPTWARPVPMVPPPATVAAAFPPPVVSPPVQPPPAISPPVPPQPAARPQSPGPRPAAGPSASHGETDVARRRRELVAQLPAAQGVERLRLMAELAKLRSDVRIVVPPTNAIQQPGWSKVVGALIGLVVVGLILLAMAGRHL